MYIMYNIQLNSPQLAYNFNIKKYYLEIIKKNNLLKNKIKKNSTQTSYNRIYVPYKSISYP